MYTYVHIIMPIGVCKRNRYIYTWDEKHKSSKEQWNKRKKQWIKTEQTLIKMMTSLHNWNAKNVRIPSGRRGTVQCHCSTAPPLQWWRPAHTRCTAVAPGRRLGGRGTPPSSGLGEWGHTLTWGPVELGASSGDSTWCRGERGCSGDQVISNVSGNCSRDFSLCSGVYWSSAVSFVIVGAGGDLMIV